MRVRATENREIGMIGQQGFMQGNRKSLGFSISSVANQPMLISAALLLRGVESLVLRFTYFVQVCMQLRKELKTGKLDASRSGIYCRIRRLLSGIVLVAAAATDRGTLR